ncbi:Ig-like domain-containing protein [Kitasatospora sp. NPDC057015]|uniref:Ig-like domain-containing protein n=1 Tax=Kitasatospora sp. NPDC057015 TaxID=3346001 RepID=UPI00363A4CB7
MSRPWSQPAAGAPPYERRTGRSRVLAPGPAVLLLAAALLLGWTAPPARAQQTPDGWSDQGRATLPSGLAVQLEFAAAPGVTATAEPGRLADPSGGARPAAYADGLRPGAPARAFTLAEDRPRADGSWRTLGTLRIAFSRPVRSPRLHVSGLAAHSADGAGSTATAARLTVTGGSPAAPVLAPRTAWTGWTVAENALGPGRADGGAPDAVAEGSLELAGTFSTATLRIEQRASTRGGATAPAPLRQAYTVTLDETLGTAPAGYTNASHLATDLLLGADANPGPAREAGSGVARAGSGAARVAAGPVAGSADPGPLVELDHGAGRRSVFADRTPPRPEPGRGEYQGADPAVRYPAEASIGRYYRLSVPVSAGGTPATLAGWIDFDRNGRFDAAERVQTEAPAGATAAGLEWIVPPGASSGETWARLRIGREAAQLVAPGGFADSGAVEDQRVRLAVGAARPEIGSPVAGSTVADARPQVRGEGAIAGAAVEIREGTAVLCRAAVGQGGAWSCRPDSPLSQGPHSLTPVETTTGGVVLTGDPVRFAVKSGPPAAPLLSLPEFTNDPAPLLTGTGEPGSTVSVGDTVPGGDRPAAVATAGAAAAATAVPAAGELCSTRVGSAGTWACLPVENLSDGTHRLTPAAVDAAGNRATGPAVALVVDTVAPAAPVLSSPAAGEVLRAARPRFAGRAEGGATVTLAARADSAPTSTSTSTPASASASTEAIPVCSAVAAVDGGWSCTAARDLAVGVHSLVVSATDRAGNGTAAHPVTVRVGAPVGAPVGTPSGSPAGRPSAVPTPGTPTPTSTPKPTPTPPAPAGAAAAPSASGPASVTAASSAALPATSSASASPAGRRSAGVLPPGGSSADRVAPAAPDSASSDQALAAPWAIGTVARHRVESTGWRAALAGCLLLLTGVGLITRRVFGRGPGRRRR